MSTDVKHEATEKEIILEFLQDAKQFLIDYLAANNRNATGNTSRNILEKEVSNFGGKLVGPDHVFYVFTGRGPGKFPPLSDIVAWCVTRGIPRSAAWPIAMKIKNEGTKLFREGGRKDNALLSVTTPEKIDGLISKLKGSYIDRLKSEVVNINRK